MEWSCTEHDEKTILLCLLRCSECKARVPAANDRMAIVVYAHWFYRLTFTVLRADLYF